MSGHHSTSQPDFERPGLGEVFAARHRDIVASWKRRTSARPSILFDHLRAILNHIADGCKRGLRALVPLSIESPDTEQLVAEYQALRRAVREACSRVPSDQLDYFDDAIDAAILATTARAQRSMEELRWSEARLRAMFDHAPAAMFIKDTDGRFVMVNRTCAALLGGPVGEIVGRLEHEIVPLDVADEHLDNDRRALETGRPIELAESLPYKGEVRSFLTVKFAAPGPHDKPLVCGIATDITERTRVEEGQRLLAGAGRILAGSLDYEKTLARVSQLATPALAEACSVDILENGKLRRLITVVDTAELQAVREFVESGAPSLESNRAVPMAIRSRVSFLLPELDEATFSRFETPDSLRRSLSVLRIQSIMVVPLIGRTEVLGALAFAARDRKYGPLDLGVAEGLARLAADSIDNARLYRTAMEATRHREDVLAIVSHDLRSPLTTIGGAARMLSRCAADEDCAKNVEIVQSSTQRMQRLIGDLLEATAIRAGRLIVMRRPENLTALLAESVDAHEAAAATRGITIERRFGATPIALSCDRDRIAQVLGNLVGNALRFCHEGDAIVVAAEIRARDVLVSITDTGPGIEQSDLAHLFDPYWSARRHQGKGTGLGLYISKGLIEAHGGKIGVESQIARGTTFWFTLPRA